MADDIQRHLDEELAGGWSRRALLKLGALLHDVGKPRTRSVVDGAIHFYGHDQVGAQMAQEIASRLRLPNEAGTYVVSLVREHMRPVHLGNTAGAPTRRAVYRLYRDAGDAAWGVALLSACDLLATTGPADRARWRRCLEVVHTLLLLPGRDPGVVKPRRLLSGYEVMEILGTGPGPLVGRALRALEEAQAAGEISSREEAIAYLKSRLPDTRGGAADA
jgi:putative nucleotidyltransferase with HDIG domain